jgi:ferredoxin
MPTVKFVNEKKTIEVPEGANLRKEAMKAGVELYSGPHKVFNCHGFGQCASCRVRIAKGTENVNRQGLFEKLRLLLGPVTFFARLGQEDEVRLACKTRVRGNVGGDAPPVVARRPFLGLRKAFDGQPEKMTAARRTSARPRKALRRSIRQVS